jgi:hypothetical protein
MTTLKQLYRLKDKEKKIYKKLNKIHTENYCLHCGYLGGDSKEQRQWELDYIKQEGVCSACDNEDLIQDILNDMGAE